jgi:uncharacterized membrane protein YccC
MMTYICERFNLDPARLPFTLRTALAACLAVYIAWLAGLEHPQWAGMTVWAASQPVRGALLEKSIFRVLGTVIGVLFGTLLLIVSHAQPWILVIGLSLWIGACSAAGNVARGFTSYGAMLAGYSAAMVALLHSHHTNSPFAIGIDRLLTVLTGVLVAVIIGWCFANKEEVTSATQRVQQLTRQVIDNLIAHLSHNAPSISNQTLLSDMALLEDALDHRAAGSWRSRQHIKAIRRQLFDLVALLFWMRRHPKPPSEAACIQALTIARSADNPYSALRQAATLANQTSLRETLLQMVTTLQHDTPSTQSRQHFRQPHTVVLHRDWITARLAFLRTTCALLIAGSIWVLSDWTPGIYLMLGTAIMMTIFSTADNPAVLLRTIFLAQVLGTVGALACRWLVWPWMQSEAGLILAMMPFIVFGGILFSHRKAGALGMDFNMILLLLLQPLWPLPGTLTESLSAGLGVILAPLLGLLAFRYIYPVNDQRRLHNMITMMVNEVTAIASQRGSSARHAIWRARLFHRILRLVRYADKTGTDKSAAIDASFTILLLGSTALHADALLQHTTLPPTTYRHLHVVLARLTQLPHQLPRLTRTLQHAAISLSMDTRIDTNLLRETASELTRSAHLLQEQSHQSSTRLT